MVRTFFILRIGAKPLGAAGCCDESFCKVELLTLLRAVKQCVIIICAYFHNVPMHMWHRLECMPCQVCVMGEPRGAVASLHPACFYMCCGEPAVAASSLYM